MSKLQAEIPVWWILWPWHIHHLHVFYFYTVETHSIMLLTKLVRLASTRLLVRAVSSLGLHETPAACFLGACPASKLCIRITIQANTTFRKPANASARWQLFKIHHLNSKIWKNCAFGHALTNEWRKVSCMAYCTCSVFHSDSAQVFKYDRDWFLHNHTGFLYLHSSQRRRVKEGLKINFPYLSSHILWWKKWQIYQD